MKAKVKYHIPLRGMKAKVKYHKLSVTVVGSENSFSATCYILDKSSFNQHVRILKISDRIQYSGGFVETLIMVMGSIFTVGMLILLPKYAKFIHNQPKMHLDKKRQEEEDSINDQKNPRQDA